MTSLNSTRKVFVQLPNLVARNVDQISSLCLTSQTIKLPERHDLLKKAANDSLTLNWFNSAWGKTKNAVLDNWESAGLIKRRKPVDDKRKSAATTTGRAFKTDEAVSQNLSEKFISKTRDELSNQVKNVSSSVDELSKAKNKAQRQLAENWEAIKQANTKNLKNLVDDVSKSATSKIDDVSKSVKEKAQKIVDETTKDIKSKM